MRTSGAVQLRDLSLELVRQGHQPTVMVPAADLGQAWQLEEMQGVQVLRLKAPRTKDIGYVRRTLGELLMPYAMLKSLRQSPLAAVQWDGVIWYSPTIFLGPLAAALKQASTCRSYLILRDIFPEWAVDMGLLGRGLPYWFFKAIERRQYAVADVIGVQTPANLPYFATWSTTPGRQVEVLQNWLADAPDTGCRINVAKSQLAGRKIFVYAGNMGVAQGMGILMGLAERLRHRQDLGFLLVGRGSDAQKLKETAANRKLENVLFHDEVEPQEIPGLFRQCHVGMVALDPRHKTHNIPGKFLTYMQSGLPVLASINPGNDLADLIRNAAVGRVCTDHSVDTLQRLALDLMDEVAFDKDVSARCKALSVRLFSPASAVEQITAALTGR